jgi:hypothetical protein
MCAAIEQLAAACIWGMQYASLSGLRVVRSRLAAHAGFAARLTRTPAYLAPQAIDWLLEHLRSSAPHPPEVVAMHEQRFVNSLELAVRFGKVGRWQLGRAVL